MGFENGIDELFYKKAEEDLDECVDMIKKDYLGVGL